MDETAAAKQAIRERILKLRSGLGERERAEKSAAICERILRIDAYRNAGSILFYMPIGGEADVAALIQSAMLQGKACSLPKCGPGRSLRLYRVSTLEKGVSPGAMGIPEPEGDKACECLPEELDVAVVPGVAYDRSGRRLGRGAGYFDRLLGQPGGAVLKIAPAYAFQVLGELPHEAHDAPVDIIVTEEEIIDCRKNGGETHG